MKECEATKDKGNRNELNGRKIYGRTSNDFFVKIKKGKDLRERACDIMIAFLEHEHTFLIRCGLGYSQTTHDTEGVDDD